MAKGRTANRYPAKGRVSIDAGLNNKFERSGIPDNESPDCLNVVYDDGAVQTRGGSDKLNTTSVGSYAAQGVYTRHDDTGTQTMVAWWNGTAYTWDASTFATIGSGQSVYTAGTRVYSAEYENHLFFCNGVSSPYKYGGSGDEFTLHGINPPSATASLATASTGTGLNGEYAYAITNVNTNLVESDFTVLGTHTAANENIAITSIPTAVQSWGVDTRRLYRTEAGGTTYKRLVTLSDNTTSTYDDGNADIALGVDAPDDQGLPPNFSATIYHQARLFFIDPADHLVKYTEIGNPYVVKATNFLRVGDTSGDKPKSFAIYDNSLVVFCEVNPWIIYMGDTTPANWQVLRVRATYGCRSPLGPFNYQNKVMFPAIRAGKFMGFSAVSGQTVSPSATILTGSAVGSEMQSDRIEPDMFLINEGAVGEITSFVYENKAYISVPYGISQLTNNRIYVFDFSLGKIKQQEASWVPWSGINAYDFTEINGKLYSQSSIANGHVYELNTSTYNDDGAAINSYAWTKEFSGISGDESTHKDYRDMQLFFELAGAYYMNVNVRTDSDAGDGNVFQFDLTSASSLWGSFVWGTDNWSAGADDKEERRFIAPLRGKRVQFKFSNQNTIDQKFKLVGLNYSYNRKGVR